MLLLIGFAFLAGIVTVLSPCILPVLPIILSSSVGKSKARPIGVVTVFVLSFTFFTLFLSTLVKISGVSADSVRFFSIVVLALFGLSLLIPKIQVWTEQLFARFSGSIPQGQNRQGFFGGLLVGFSLGLLWTPCVGPILASVISLALVGTVTLQAVFITLAYALGTAIPMFMIMLAGSTALQKIPWLLRNTGRIQKAFGVLMIATAVGIYFNVDRQFQSYILDKFPEYGVGLTKIEDNELVKKQLDSIANQAGDEDMGKPSFKLMNDSGPTAPKLIPGGEWFNLAERKSDLSLKELQAENKVVLIDFWTYSCINCQRTLPYLRDWWQKYESEGLVIIGVHAPEFEFEKNPKNVQKAITDFELKYPIVQDNDFSTWRAYNNRYWPAKYLIDSKGKIRYSHFGEGAYDETEMKIQELLKEANENFQSLSVENPEYQIFSRTSETYLGYQRLGNFASNEKIVKDALQQYSAPENIPANQVAYTGSWIVTPENAQPTEGAQLFLNFEAKDVFLVARPKNKSASFDVYLDGEKQDSVIVDSDSLYQLVELENPGRHLLRLDFFDNELELFAFTFG